ncbi:biotin--[acetyl-CoA-carboxylase] ligase [Wolbachia endosymbiont of Folsomia candida]|nr:biotin--[acetyl-CoA-carboxylase] ligase [Wolbachia endosymbiont of Folsomia candida]APR98531.1 biotin--[acetyl-CoA-carboxylase] ligase [Wolbachia endosymbiont of Folsomia candida]
MVEVFENFHIHHYKEVSSTNEEARDLIDKEISTETVIIADKQTNGRGRTGKSWVSPEGNFYASLIIEPLHNHDLSEESAAHFGVIPATHPVIQVADYSDPGKKVWIPASRTGMTGRGAMNQKTDVNKLTELTFIAALAVGNTLLSLMNDSNIQYKWPNDILIDGKKISGILLERKSNSNWLIIGIGININHAPLAEATCISRFFAQPSVIPVPDTGIQKEAWIPASATCMTPLDLLKELITNFNKLRKEWLLSGFLAIRAMWLQRAFKLNKQISIKLSDKLYEGAFTDIDKSGRLVLQQKDGSLIYFDAGELFIDDTL